MTAFDEAQSRRSALTGLAAGLAATTMLFAALASAYVVRRGISSDWTNVPLPDVLYASVAPVFLTTWALAAAHRHRAAHRRMWLGLAAIAAVMIGGMHVYAWRQLRSRGISLDASPAASFLFVIGGTFLLYVMAGLVAIIPALTSGRNPRVEVLSYYWCYLSALWVFLLAFLWAWG